MPKIKVLFLCVGNLWRSQMAEGWTRHLWGETVEPYSAWPDKSGSIPHAAHVMAEAGVDIPRQTSKTAAGLGPTNSDCAVTGCARASQRWPIFLGSAKVMHATFDDPPSLTGGLPAGEAKLAVYRRVRDEIKRFVRTLPNTVREELRIETRNAQDEEQSARRAPLIF